MKIPARIMMLAAIGALDAGAAAVVVQSRRVVPSAPLPTLTPSDVERIEAAKAKRARRAAKRKP